MGQMEQDRCNIEGKILSIIEIYQNWNSCAPENIKTYFRIFQLVDELKADRFVKYTPGRVEHPR